MAASNRPAAVFTSIVLALLGSITACSSGSAHSVGGTQPVTPMAHGLTSKPHAVWSRPLPVSQQQNLVQLGVFGDTALVLSGPTSAAELAAFDVATGRLEWNAKLPPGVAHAAGPAADGVSVIDGVVTYARWRGGSPGSAVSALVEVDGRSMANGRQLWSIKPPAPETNGGLPPGQQNQISWTSQGPLLAHCTGLQTFHCTITEYQRRLGTSRWHRTFDQYVEVLPSLPTQGQESGYPPILPPEQRDDVVLREQRGVYDIDLNNGSDNARLGSINPDIPRPNSVLNVRPFGDVVLVANVPSQTKTGPDCGFTMTGYDRPSGKRLWSRSWNGYSSIAQGCVPAEPFDPAGADIAFGDNHKVLHIVNRRTGKDLRTLPAGSRVLAADTSAVVAQVQPKSLQSSIATLPNGPTTRLDTAGKTDQDFVLTRDVVYGFQSNSDITAYDRHTGAVRWRLPTKQPVASLVSIDRGIIYVDQPDNRIIRLG